MKAIISSLVLTATAAAIAQMDMGESRYGGPVYSGPPKLDITARVLKNGGGAKFSVAKGVVAIVGKKQAHAAFLKLAKQYGKERTARFVEIFDFAVSDAAKIAAAAKVKLPPASKETGRRLAATLVRLGIAPDHVFYTEYFLDHLLGHKIHMQVVMVRGGEGGCSIEPWPGRDPWLPPPTPSIRHKHSEGGTPEALASARTFSFRLTELESIDADRSSRRALPALLLQQ